MFNFLKIVSRDQAEEKTIPIHKTQVSPSGLCFFLKQA
jgi:hypothetical protein